MNPNQKCSQCQNLATVRGYRKVAAIGYSEVRFCADHLPEFEAFLKTKGARRELPSETEGE